MKINRRASLEKLKTLDWQDLDWLERTARRLKADAPGIRIFSNTSDPIAQEEGKRAMESFFEGAREQTP